MTNVPKTSSFSVTNPSYVIYNVDNYNKTIQDSLESITTKYVLLIIEYMRFMNEKIAVKNPKNYTFIFINKN